MIKFHRQVSYWRKPPAAVFWQIIFAMGRTECRIIKRLCTNIWYKRKLMQYSQNRSFLSLKASNENRRRILSCNTILIQRYDAINQLRTVGLESCNIHDIFPRWFTPYCWNLRVESSHITSYSLRALKLSLKNFRSKLAINQVCRAIADYWWQRYNHGR